MEGAKFDLHWIDYTIVLVYFMGIIAHGVYVSKKMKEGADGYFLAGRALPWYLIGFSLYASNMSGSSFVGLMGGAYENGIVIFNYEWTAALVLVFFAIFILPSYLRAKVSTVPEYLEKRYDVRSRSAFSIFTLLAIMFIDTAGALYAGGLVISNTTPLLNLWGAVAFLALVAGVHTIFGGLSAVVVTDTVQAILLMIGAAIIFGIGLMEIGGWSQLFADVPEGHTQLIMPASVVVYVLGIFWPRLNGNGAFWTIILGLVVGIPIFIAKEVFFWWTDIGLPDIHYTVMSTIMMFVGTAIHIGISYATSKPESDAIKEVVWDDDDFAEDIATFNSPWYGDYKASALNLSGSGNCSELPKIAVH